MNQLWDRLGISASILCIVHCLATPLLVMLIPMFGPELAHGWFHLVIAAIVIPLAVGALWNGYKIHRHREVLWLGGVGIFFVSAALMAQPDWEMPLMIVAGLLLSSAHYFNLRNCRLKH